MRSLHRIVMVAASVSAALLMAASPAFAAGPGGGGGGTGGGGGGGKATQGSSYSDLNIVLRATNGTPVLKKFTVPPTSETTSTTIEYCPQPISATPVPGIASTVDPVDGQTVWVLPLQGEWINTPASPIPNTTLTACAAQPQDAMFVSEVDLERLNMARTTDTVTARRLATVTKLLESATTIGLESTGRILINTTPTTPIDSPNENQAIYKSLLWTGTIPGLPSTLASPQPHIGIFNAMDLAAAALGATASKTIPLTVDAIEYYNQVIGYPPAPATFTNGLGLKFLTSTDPSSPGQPLPGSRQYVNFTTIGGHGPFTYNRADTFPGSVTWLTVPHLSWKVTPIVTAVPFHNITPQSSNGTLTGVAAFAQMADDVRSLCNYIPDNTFIPGFFMDAPGQNTTATQLKAITEPAVSLGKLPANVIETLPFTVTSQVLNPSAGSSVTNARLRVTVHATTGALGAGDVSATATTGQSVPFTASGTELAGWWGPGGGFMVAPGYNESTTFTVTVGPTAPTGTYTVTLDLVTVLDGTQVLATDTAKITVLPDAQAVFWGSGLPRLMTQEQPTALPLSIYSPVAGTGTLDLTVTGPPAAPTTALKASDLSVYGSNGSAMVKMPLTANSNGQVVGTWTAALVAGTMTSVILYVTASTGAPLGNYTIEVSLEGANTLPPITVTVVAPETGGGGGGGSGGNEGGNGTKTITSAASTTFFVSEPGTFTVETVGSPTPTLTVEGTLPQGVTFTDNGDGTATLAGTATTTGAYAVTIYAQYDSTLVAQTFTLNVRTPLTTPTATQLVVTTQPRANVTVDRSFAVGFSIENAAGTVLPNKTTTVTVALKAGTGTAGATLTCNGGSAKAAVTGVAGFACSIDKAGTGYVLTASATGLTSASTNAFTVAATTGGGGGSGGGSTAPSPPSAPTGATTVRSGTSTTSDGTLSLSAESVGLSVTASGTGAVTIGGYSGNPTTTTLATATGKYVDVAVASGSDFSSLTIQVCSVGTGNVLKWWNGSAWLPFSQEHLGPTGCISATVTPTSTPSLAELTGTPIAVSENVIRIDGVDAVATAIRISQAEYPVADSATAVVLASSASRSFSDALAGGPLAAYEHAPLLLTEGASTQTSLDTRVKAEIQRVLPSGATVYVLGGNLAVSPTVDAALKSLGYKVVRVAGATRYDTAYQIALQMGSPNVVFEATGTSFTDALSAVPAAIANHGAILLTDGATQSAATATYLAAHPGAVRYAIGGPLAAYGADPGAIPVYGANLYGTSAAVASRFFPSTSLFGAATSVNFADAVGGGVYMATGGRAGPLLIVDPSLPLATEYSTYLASLSSTTTTTVIFGGPLAISSDVVQALRGALG